MDDETLASLNLELGMSPESHAGFDDVIDFECIDGSVTGWSET